MSQTSSFSFRSAWLFLSRLCGSSESSVLPFGFSKTVTDAAVAKMGSASCQNRASLTSKYATLRTDGRTRADRQCALAVAQRGHAFRGIHIPSGSSICNDMDLYRAFCCLLGVRLLAACETSRFCILCPHRTLSAWPSAFRRKPLWALPRWPPLTAEGSSTKTRYSRLRPVLSAKAAHLCLYIFRFFGSPTPCSNLSESSAFGSSTTLSFPHVNAHDQFRRSAILRSVAFSDFLDPASTSCWLHRLSQDQGWHACSVAVSVPLSSPRQAAKTRAHTFADAPRTVRKETRIHDMFPLHSTSVPGVSRKPALMTGRQLVPFLT